MTGSAVNKLGYQQETKYIWTGCADNLLFLRKHFGYLKQSYQLPLFPAPYPPRRGGKGLGKLGITLMYSRFLRDYTWNTLVNKIFIGKDIVQLVMKINRVCMPAMIGGFGKIHMNTIKRYFSRVGQILVQNQI